MEATISIPVSLFNKLLSKASLDTLKESANYLNLWPLNAWNKLDNWRQCLRKETPSLTPEQAANKQKQIDKRRVSRESREENRKLWEETIYQQTWKGHEDLNPDCSCKGCQKQRDDEQQWADEVYANSVSTMQPIEILGVQDEDEINLTIIKKARINLAKRWMPYSGKSKLDNDIKTKVMQFINNAYDDLIKQFSWERKTA